MKLPLVPREFICIFRGTLAKMAGEKMIPMEFVDLEMWTGWPRKFNSKKCYELGKPDDAKPDDAKPDDAKPDDAKPDDAKPYAARVAAVVKPNDKVPVKRTISLVGSTPAKKKKVPVNFIRNT